MPRGAPVFRYRKKKWNKSWEKILFLLVCAVFVLLMPGQNVYTMGGDAPETSPYRLLPFALPTPAPYPRNVTGYYPGPEITAQGVVVKDLYSGVSLYARNDRELLAPASVTKIMTALVALETYSLDQILTVTSVLNQGQVMGLVPGERITAENLLLGALIHSGNDAAYALAENYPTGVAGFIEAMNTKATALHLDQTHFTNVVGFDDPAHKTTPEDLSRLAMVALSNKTIARMVAIPQITISDVSFTYFHALKNVNQLLGKIPGVGGIKTGWTEEAGENLITMVDRGGHRIIIVVLHSKDRFLDTTKLIDWVFANYQWEEVKEK